MSFGEIEAKRQNSYETTTWTGHEYIEPKKLMFSFSVLTSSGTEHIELSITKDDILWLMDDAQ